MAKIGGKGRAVTRLARAGIVHLRRLGLTLPRRLRENARMKAILSDDRTSFTLSRGAWSNSYPVDEAAHWLAFYRKQPVDFPKAGRAYAGSIAALEGLCRDLGLPV